MYPSTPNHRLYSSSSGSPSDNPRGHLRPPVNWWDLPALLAPILLIVWLYHDATGLWWQLDDTQILKHALEHSPRAYFLDPATWRLLSPVNLTPWVSLSFDFDLALFGMDPHAFYVHQLISIALAAIATYLLLRLWVAPLFASLAVSAFLAGAPVACIAFQLMTRHYVEGLVLAVAAIYLYVIALRSGHRRWALIGAICYLMATTAKEVYVPLIGVLLFLPEADLRQRIRYSVPYLVVAALYVPWRMLMLGTPVGGYTGAAASLEIARIGVSRAGEILFGNGGLAILALISLIVGLIWALAVAPKRIVLACLIGAAAIFPAAFVARYLDPRHLMSVWWALCVGSCIAFAAVAKTNRRGSVVAGVLIAAPLAAIIQAGRACATSTESLAITYAAYGRHWLSAGADTVIFVGPPIADMGHYFLGLTHVAERLSGPREFPTRAVDEIDLADIDLRHRSVWTFDPNCACLRDITSDVPARLAAWRQRVVEQPLSVDLTYQAGVAHWNFGPYQVGTYQLVDAHQVGRIQLPPNGERRTAPLNLNFYIRYDAPEGWTTYSPQLRLVSDGSVNWRR